MASLKISLFVVFCIYLQFAQGLHQIISESEKKCFIEEVPRDTLVLVTWKAEDLTRSHAEQNENPLGFKIVVRDPDQQNVYQKQHGFSGRAAFTSLVGGEYQVCAQTNASRWFGTNIEIKFEIDIESGSSAVDYDELAQAEHLTELQTEARRLNDQAREVIKEQSYLKAREVVAREDSEALNARVMWWSIAETLLLVGSGIWQIRHLKQFFRQKKLV